MGNLINNPVLSMTKGQNKILAGFNPDGTAKFAFTQHDNNPTVGTLQFPDVVITPKTGTIDELGNVYNNIGGTRYMTTPSGRRYNIGEIPISNVDPLAKFYVEGTALVPAFNLAGKAGLYGFAKYAPIPGMRNLKQGIQKIKNTTKLLWNNGKLIQNKIPINPNNYYRAINKDALIDAINNKIIRTIKHTGEDEISFKGPFFSKGDIYSQYGDYIIEGNPKHIQWIKPWEYQNNGNVIPSKGSAFPYYNGTTSVPTNGFTYWKKHPIIGWRQYNFKQGGQIVKDFKQKFQKKK